MIWESGGALLFVRKRTYLEKNNEKLMFIPLRKKELFKVLYLIVMECEGRQLEFHVVCVEGEPETPL